MHKIKGFIRAEGPRLVDGEGRDVLLRGVGLGGWLLPEGYMWRFPAAGDRPRRMEGVIEELIGQEKAKRFWELYFERFITQADIRQIAAEGFNSIRIPMNARWMIAPGKPLRFNERVMQCIDRVIGWCGESGLYAILDLHAAPGGQTGTNIDDSEHDRPELFEREENKHTTVLLWRMLAQRYRDEPAVAGYDLLNEPLPEWFSEYNGEVMPLYKRIANAIREVDRNHMIILEGVHWATDWSVFQEIIDGNLMLQFHKYWNNPDTRSIQPYLDKRREWNVPIFMGEGGENNKDWYSGAFRLLEDHAVSWNFWTWKKMDTDNSPCSITTPAGWQMIVDYLNGGLKPDADAVKGVLWAYLENISFDRCSYHPEVVNALLRRPPVRIPAIFYGYKGEDVSFHITQKSNTGVGFRAPDGVDIRFVQGEGNTLNFQHMRGEAWQPNEWLCVRLVDNEWLAYEFETGDAPQAQNYSIGLHPSAPEGHAAIALIMDDAQFATCAMDCELWKTIWAESQFRLGPGKHRLVLRSNQSPVLLQWLEIVPTAFNKPLQ